MKSVAGHVGVVCVALLGFTEARAQDVRQAVEALESENEVQDADLFDLFDRSSRHESRLEEARAERAAARSDLQKQAADLAELRADREGSAARRIRELAEQVSGVAASRSVLEATAVVLDYAVDGLVTLGGEVEALDAALRVTKGDVKFATGEFTATYRVLSENDASHDAAIAALEGELTGLGARHQDWVDQAEHSAAALDDWFPDPTDLHPVEKLVGAITVIDNDLIALDDRTTALELGLPRKGITLQTDNGDIFLTVGETTVGLASSEAVANLDIAVEKLDQAHLSLGGTVTQMAASVQYASDLLKEHSGRLDGIDAAALARDEEFYAFVSDVNDDLDAIYAHHLETRGATYIFPVNFDDQIGKAYYQGVTLYDAATYPKAEFTASFEKIDLVGILNGTDKIEVPCVPVMRDGAPYVAKDPKGAEVAVKACISPNYDTEFVMGETNAKGVIVLTVFDAAFLQTGHQTRVTTLVP